MRLDYNANRTFLVTELGRRSVEGIESREASVFQERIAMEINPHVTAVRDQWRWWLAQL